MTPEQAAILASAIAALIGAIAAVASAVFAFIAVRAQRSAQRPHVRVTHSTPMPVWGGAPRSFAGSTLGDPYFVIEVHNDGLLPVTVNSANVTFGDGGNAPYLGPHPVMRGDDLPKRLDPGDQATMPIDELRQIALVHVEHGGAKWVTVTLAGGAQFHGEPISKAWLDGWAKPDA